jgi:hypothetical protein
VIVTLEGRALPTVPCSAKRVPLAGHGWASATTDPTAFADLCQQYPGAPYVGVATGAASGLAVIDVDPRNGGDRWLADVRDRLPRTRAHRTGRGGWHFVYRHEPGLRCRGAIVPGVDFRAEGGGIVWGPAAGLACSDDAVAALGWLREFVTGSPPQRKHPLFAESSDLGRENASSERPAPPKTLDLIRRSRAILQCVETAPAGTRNKCLFWAACRFAEMLAEGAIERWVAERLLEQAARQCGLVRDDGPGAVRATIGSGLGKFSL